MKSGNFQIECSICLETIDDEIEIDVLVYFEFSPEEPQTYWDPGCSAEINIYDVILTTPKYNGFELIDFDYLCITKGKLNSCHEDLEEQCWDHMSEMSED